MKTKGKKSKEGFEYQYFIKDHLGNTRVMLSQTGQVLQQNAYYPFGMLISMPQPDLVNQNKYLYNGKELQTDFGLDWYDYGARFYDAQLGRFNAVDPLTEWHFNFSNYHYCFNNPINNIDPFGLDTISVNNDNWHDFDPEEDVAKLDEVEITDKKPSWLSKTLKAIGHFFSSNINTTQNGGIPLTTSGDTYSQTIYEAIHPDDPVNIDILLLVTGFGGAGQFERSFLDFAKSVDKVNSIVKITSDKEIVESHTGIGEKTDANGKPIGKYKNSRKQESKIRDSSEIITLYYEDRNLVMGRMSTTTGSIHVTLKDSAKTVKKFNKIQGRKMLNK